MKTIDYLNDIQDKTELYKDIEFAEWLGTSKQNISQIKKGKRFLNIDECIKIADELNIDKNDILITVQLEKEKEPLIKHLWEMLTKLRKKN